LAPRREPAAGSQAGEPTIIPAADLIGTSVDVRTSQNARLAPKSGVTDIYQASPTSDANSRFRDVRVFCVVSVVSGCSPRGEPSLGLTSSVWTTCEEARQVGG